MSKKRFALPVRNKDGEDSLKCILVCTTSLFHVRAAQMAECELYSVRAGA